MTNINCSKNCVYQNDGKCCFDNTSKVVLTPDSKCAFFSENKEEDFS